MRANHRGEYDNYSLPELLKKETPESKEKKKEALKRLNALVENSHRDDKPEA